MAKNDNIIRMKDIRRGVKAPAEYDKEQRNTNSHIQFDAKIWRNGKSLLLTVPKHIREQYNLNENDVLRIQARLTSRNEIDKEKELRKKSVSL